MVKEVIAENSETNVIAPLITFALFTYNQEQFVRQAIESAFAQAYEPLEIIVSDDCSTDLTFEIVKEMTAQYQGAHRVVARSTVRNLGTFAHVVEVASEARGDLIILASGDDISKPERSSELHKAWVQTGAWGLHSKYDRINNYGVVEGTGELSQPLLMPEYRLRRYFYQEDGEVNIVHGATSAYDRRLFDYIDKETRENILSEDGALSLVLNMLNKGVCALDQSLVLYRSHSGSLTNAPRFAQRITVKSISDNVAKSATYARSCEQRARFAIRFYESGIKNELRRINTEEINRDIQTFKVQSEWADLTFIDRLKYLLVKPDLNRAKWMLPRLFGQRFFTLTKYGAKNLEYYVHRFRKSV